MQLISEFACEAVECRSRWSGGHGNTAGAGTREQALVSCVEVEVEQRREEVVRKEVEYLGTMYMQR